MDISTRTIATIDARHDISVADLCDAVEQAGYRAEERTAVDDDDAESTPDGAPQKRPRWSPGPSAGVTVGHMGG